MLRKTALLSALWLCACDPAPAPAPNIASIEPEEVVSGEASTITLALDAPLPVKVDYGRRAATVQMPALLIGGQKVAITHLEQDGTLTAIVPPDLAAGPQDVRLELEDGNTSALARGLTVLPAPPALETLKEDGGSGDGTPETPPLTGLTLDPIPDQVRDVPFTVTLRAEGPEAARFTGRVLLSSNKGHVSPNLSNPFSLGVRQERIVLDRPGGNVVLTVRVGRDIAVQSNPFKVHPR